MQDLIERLEKAEGPDRELDGAIWCGLFQTIAECWPHWTPRQQNELPPDYTRSIDTALTVVPEGLPWEVSSDRISRALASVCTTKDNGQYIDETLRGTGPLNAPAIALIIAALKARAASSAGKEG